MREHRSRGFDVLWYGSALLGWRSAIGRHVAPLVLMINDEYYALAGDLFLSYGVFGLKRSLVRKSLRIFEKQSARQADLLVVNSEYLKRQIVRCYGVDEERIRFLPKGVDLTMFGGRKPAEDIDLANVRVFFLKNNYVTGGLEDLLRALSRLPFQATLTVAGPSEREWSNIRRMAETAGFKGKLKLLGIVQRREVVAQFAQQDILCVPSKSEAFGVAFLEALASGVPAIGGRVGGIPEVLCGGEAGWLVEPGDPVGLSQILKRVVLDRGMRTKKIERGLHHAQRYSVPSMIDRFEEISLEAAHRSASSK